MSRRRATLMACVRLVCAAGAIAAASTQANAQMFPPYDVPPVLDMAPLVNLDTFVDIPGNPQPQPLKAHDISVAPDGTVWIASDHGLLKKAGVGWKLQTVTAPVIGDQKSTSTIPNTVTVGVRRVDVDPKTGTVWIVDATGALALQEKNGQWRRVATNIVDFGVANGVLWAIPGRDPNVPRATDGAIMMGNADKMIGFYGWWPQLGNPIGIDVAPGGDPWIITDKGVLVWTTAQKTAEHNPGYWVVKSAPTNCPDPVANGTAPGCGSPNRSYNGLGVIDDQNVWVAGRDENGSYARIFVDDGPLLLSLRVPYALSAVGSDGRGHLNALTDQGAPVYGELLMISTANTSESYSELMNAYKRPAPPLMGEFKDGVQPVTVRVIAEGVNHAEALNPSNDFTVAFSVMPFTDGTSVTTGPQCLLSLRSATKNVFSVCLDGTQSKISLKMGETEKTFPVNLTNATYGQKAVARRFILQTSLSEAKLYSVDETWKPNASFPGISEIDQANIVVVGSFAFPAIRTDASPTLRLHIGGRTESTDLFRGYLGPVRVWRGASVAPTRIFTVHDAGMWAGAQSPAPQSLIIDAPLALDGKADKLPVKLLSPMDISGLWTVENGRSEYDAVEISTSKEQMRFARDRIQLLRIKFDDVRTDKPFASLRLRILRDGEGGIVETTWHQTASDTYVGWREPQKGDFPTGIIKPFTLKVMDGNRIRISHPNGRDSVLFKRIGDPVNTGGPPDRIDQPLENYVGYNIATISPYNTAGIGDGDNGKRARIFDFQQRDAAGNVVATPDTRKWPWGTFYDSIDSGGSTNSERVVETSRELQEDLRASVGVGAEMEEVFSFSASADFEQSVERMLKEKAVLSVGEVWSAGYGLVLDPARVSLEAGFRQLVEEAAGMPASRDRDNVLDNLIDVYGTHYTNYVVFGCRARYEKKISETEIARAVEQQWNSSAKASGTYSGVEVSMEGSFGRGSRSSFEKSEEKTETRITTEAGTVSFDAEEVTCGDDKTRGNPIARDLRPITDVLSPVFFASPTVYRDLRYALGMRILQKLRALPNRTMVSDANALPELYVVTLDSFTPSLLGDENSVEGEVAVNYTPAGESEAKKAVIWNGSGETAAKPSSAEGTKIAIAKRVYINLMPGATSAQLVANLRGPGSSSQLATITEDLMIDSVRGSGGRGGTVSAIGPECQCVSACPDGYVDDDGACLKSCPPEFIDNGGTCYGSYSRTFYVAWAMDLCKQQNPSSDCKREGWGIYPVCKPGFMPVEFGICQVRDCATFGLDNWAGWTLTCSKPEASRTSTGRSASNSCPANATPGTDCPRVAIAYTVQKVTLED